MSLAGGGSYRVRARTPEDLEEAGGGRYEHACMRIQPFLCLFWRLLLRVVLFEEQHPRGCDADVLVVCNYDALEEFCEKIDLNVSI